MPVPPRPYARLCLCTLLLAACEAQTIETPPTIASETVEDRNATLVGDSLVIGDFQLRTETAFAPDGSEQFQRFWYSEDATPDSFALLYEDGRLVRGDYFNASRELVFVYRFEVDEEGRRLRETYEGPAGEMQGSTVYEYQGSTNSARQAFTPDGTPAARYEDGLSSDGRIPFTDYIDGSDTSRTAYEYIVEDEDGRWLQRLARALPEDTVWQHSLRTIVMTPR